MVTAAALGARRDLLRGPRVGARRDADQDALLGGESPRRGERVVGLDGQHLVVDAGVEHFGDEAGADPLEGVRRGLPAGEHGRGGGLDGDHAQGGLALAQAAPHAGDGAAGPDGGDEDVDLALGVGPDLLRRRALVHLGIGRVLELLRDEGVVAGRRQVGGARHGALHAVGPGRELEPGPVGEQQLAALDGHRLRHAEHDVVAAWPRRPWPARCRCCRWSAR